MNNNKSQEYGEFKGKTEAILTDILGEIKGLRHDVDSLKGWKSYTIGIGAMAGLVAAFLKDFIKIKI